MGAVAAPAWGISQIAVPAALSLIGMIAGIGGAGKQRKQQERALAEQKKAQRRGAIERAMGGTFFSRPAQQIQPADLTTNAIIQGLANIGATAAPGIIQGIGAAKAPQIPKLDSSKYYASAAPPFVGVN